MDDELKKLESIEQEVDQELTKVDNINDLMQKKATYLGKKGPFVPCLISLICLTGIDVVFS